MPGPVIQQIKLLQVCSSLWAGAWVRAISSKEVQGCKQSIDCTFGLHSSWMLGLPQLCRIKLKHACRLGGNSSSSLRTWCSAVASVQTLNHLNAEQFFLMVYRIYGSPFLPLNKNCDLTIMNLFFSAIVSSHLPILTISQNGDYKLTIANYEARIERLFLRIAWYELRTSELRGKCHNC